MASSFSLTRSRSASCRALFTLLVLTCGVAVAAPAAPATQPTTLPSRKASAQAKELFKKGLIPRLRIELSREQGDKLRNNDRSYAHCTVRETLPGQPERVYTDVGIHLKGGPGSFRPIDDRPGLTLQFDRFNKTQKFHGLDKLNLNNSVQDPTYMSENLGGYIFRQADIPAARCTNAHVWLNQRDLGMYVLKEGFEDEFLKHNFDDPSGVLFEGAFTDIDGNLAARESKGRNEQRKFREIYRAAITRDPALRREKLEKILDCDRFLTFMALEAMTAHWDGYCANQNNYRVYLDPSQGKFVFLPHGMDQLFQQPGYPLILGKTILPRVFTESEQDRAKYMERVAELRKKVFVTDKLLARIDRMSSHLMPAMQEIGPEAVKQHQEMTAMLRQRVIDRGQHIDRLLTIRPLKFNEAGIASISQNQWDSTTLDGNAEFEKAMEAGKTILKIKTTNGCTASFRSAVQLAPGRYSFEARCRTIAVVPTFGQNPGAGVRISGQKRPIGIDGTTDWKITHYDFELDGTRDALLVCELKAESGEVQFDVGSMQIRRR